MTVQRYRSILIRELWWQGYTLKQAALIASKILSSGNGAYVILYSFDTSAENYTE